MRLNQVTVPTRNLLAYINFYTKLGLKLIVKSEPHYARFELPEGDTTFSVHLVEKLPEGDGIYVYFESDRLDEWVDELQNQDFEFEILPTDQRWLWREARLKDPDGNQLILFYGGKNRKNPPWRL